VDRAIQQAVAQVPGPAFGAGFSDASFGFRPSRFTHGDLRRVQGCIDEDYPIAIDLGFTKFFDNVPGDVLLARVGREVRNTRLLTLIARYLRAGDRAGQASRTFLPGSNITLWNGVI